MTETMVFPAGSAIIFTSGEYSDFGICGCVVTLKQCDLKSLMKEYISTAEAGWDSTPSLDDFPSWLVAQGHAFSADTQRVHVGDYSQPNTDLVSEFEYLEIKTARESEGSE